MSTANWTTQSYGRIQSLLFNNPKRVIHYMVNDGQGHWRDRANRPAPVTRLYETEAPSERTCLQTIQFVHHMIIPPGGRHVEELHIHPDAEELVIILRGEGTMILGGVKHLVRAEDVIYIPPNVEHELVNSGDDMLFCLFINVPTGDALQGLKRPEKNS